MAAKDRSHLALIDTMVEPEQRDRLFAALRPLADDPEFSVRVRELYERLDDLADADADDPRVGPLGDELAACMPDELLDLMGEGAPQTDSAFGDAFLDDFAPAQAAAARRMLAALAVRAKERR